MGIDTLHEYSIRDIEAIAKTLGFSVETNPGSAHGPDLVLKYDNLIIYVESEIGHDTGSSKEYFNKLLRRLRNRINQDNGHGQQYSIIVITNTPRRLANAIPTYQDDLKNIGFLRAELGKDIYIVPALLYRELIPAILVRLLSFPSI